MRALLLRIERYITRSRPACRSTASPVMPMNQVVRFSIAYASASAAQAWEEPHAAYLQILGRSRLGRRLVICLTACFVRGAELLLLLAHDIASPIDPLRGLILGFAGAALHVFPAFLGARAQHFPRLAAGARRI